MKDRTALHCERIGRGKPLLLIHGLGGSGQSWKPVIAGLATNRELIVIDLPGHGRSPPRSDSGTFAGLVASVEAFLADENLEGVAVAGSSLGARIALELARRGKVADTVALDPGGFWRGWERRFFKTTIGVSVGLLRALRPLLPALGGNAIARSALLAQLSTRPWALDPDLVRNELVSIAGAPTFSPLVHDLSEGPEQRGPQAPGSGRITIGWGRHDRLCLPRQAARAAAAFPEATLHWFERSGHFPLWDEPEETVALILARS
jgi:pimeloyl-ACP methyl ester carboxylesterase